MKRPRLAEREKLVDALRSEVQWVRHAWELGRLQRRAIADFECIVKGAVHYATVPIRAGDPRAARAQLDRQLQSQLRRNGHYDEQGLIYGGQMLIAHRPFVTETLEALRTRLRELRDAFVLAKFATPLEQAAFRCAPKDPNDDRGAPRDKQWVDAWLRVTHGRHPKSIACEAIGISEKAYDERRRRPQAKAGGLTIREQELIEQLEHEMEQDRKSIENHESYRRDALHFAAQCGAKLPRHLRTVPSYTKATRKQLTLDVRFLDDDLVRWRACLREASPKMRPTWRALIALREQRIARLVRAMAIHAWLEDQTRAATTENRS
jgi:hypothetical protein